MRELKWICINVIMIALLIAGFCFNIKGAEHVAVFWVYFSAFMISFMIFSEKVRMDVVNNIIKYDIQIPLWFRATIQIFIMMFFIWFDRWIIGIVSIMPILIIESSIGMKRRNG